MRRLFCLAALFTSLVAASALTAACGDNTSPPQQTPDAGVDGPPPGSKVGPCLARPTDLDRPPVTSAGAGALPCELLPPGFVAP